MIRHSKRYREPKIIAVDFDGVIHDHKHRDGPGRALGPPIPGALDSLRQLKRQGHTLVIHSVWGDSPAMKEWCDQHGVPYDDITNIKPNAHYYLDDRAIRFTSWQEALEQLTAQGARV